MKSGKGVRECVSTLPGAWNLSATPGERRQEARIQTLQRRKLGVVAVGRCRIPELAKSAHKSELRSDRWRQLPGNNGIKESQGEYLT